MNFNYSLAYVSDLGHIKNWIPAVGLSQAGRTGHYVRAAVVGVLSGLLALGFQVALLFAESGRREIIDWAKAREYGEYWGWLILPLVGLIVGSGIGLLTQFSPESAGSGIPHLKAVLLHARNLRWHALIPVKFVSAVAGIGAGLSLGREGPTVQMGAAVGKMVADALRLPPRLVPQLISCGAGAGLAAAFNAPLAGVLFVVEELHRELSALTFGGALVAALCANIVARSVTGQMPSFSVTGYPALPLSMLVVVALLGVVCGLLGVMFNRSLLCTGRHVQKITSVPAWLKPGIAAALCGLVAWSLPQAVGGGHATADALLNQELRFGLQGLFLLLGAKFALTVISYASGAPGGIFAPMLLIGALAGTTTGTIVAWWIPSLANSIPAFAVIGMAALFTGSIRAPLTGIVLIMEMTANYDQLLALAVACLAAYLVAEWLHDAPLYDALLASELARGEGAGKQTETDPRPRSLVIAVHPGSSLEGHRILEAGIPAGCLVVSVERGGREIMPSAKLKLLSGDQLTVLLPASEPEKAMRLVELSRGL